ncbi:MAG TPA: CDP-alcohol phosphatidyltransferase family protein [Nitrososphaera sp.]|nr:CDP-alcohol phosphatidyltransferase family protein [Nitrososphaera sp.]
MSRLGASFASTGLSANFWTATALAISIAAAIAYSSANFGLPKYYAALIGGILLLISGFFDVVDGAVAKVTKHTSKRGAFLDSSFDKIAEVTIFSGIAYGRLADTFLCMIGLGLSILVSYTRARSESLGVELKGIGIGERAERLLILAIIGMIPLQKFPEGTAIQWAVIIVSILAGITLIQRIIATSKKLSST